MCTPRPYRLHCPAAAALKTHTVAFDLRASMAEDAATAARLDTLLADSTAASASHDAFIQQMRGWELEPTEKRLLTERL